MQDPIFDVTSPDPTSQRLGARLHASARPVSQPWRWPLPRLAGRDPVAIPVGEDDRGAVDVGYAGHDFGGPLFVPVYAVQRGTISFAGPMSTGYAITIDHGPLISHYAHLDRIFVLPRPRRTRRLELVQPGQVIAYAAKAPVHIRFELWETSYTQGFVPTEALSRMKEWLVEPFLDKLNHATTQHDQEAA